MTAPGKRITVVRSVVTGIRIDGSTLVIEGVDQGGAGQTLQSHQLSVPGDEDRAVGGDSLRHAIDTIRTFAQQEIDKA